MHDGPMSGGRTDGNALKYVFFGTPRFAAIVLQKLIDAGLPPAAVVCNPDRPAGRKHVITPPPVKVLAIAHGIAVLQPETFDSAFTDALRALAPDLFAVAAYAKIIPQEILDLSRLGTLGTHPSLLPKYRGASPIQSAILRGDSETGATIYMMDAKMDHGPIVAQRALAFDADSENYPSLEEKLAELSGMLLADALPQVHAGTAEPQAQDDAAATFTKKFTTQDGFISDEDLRTAEQGGDPDAARALLHKIHALNPEPGCWTMRGSKRVKLLEARFDRERGALVPTVIQEEGQKPRTVRP